MALVLSEVDEVDPNMIPAKKYTIPTGLKQYQHLLGPSNYGPWAKAMLLLFRAHGVLHIMRDAIDRSIRDLQSEATYAAERALGKPISGAERLTSADLDVWDSSDDMTLLLRADALIDASIGKEAAIQVAGIENPHAKWVVLRTWGADLTIEGYMKARNQMSVISAGDFEDPREFVRRFMEIRAEMFRTNAVEAGKVDMMFEFARAISVTNKWPSWKPEVGEVGEKLPKTWDPAMRLSLEAERYILFARTSSRSTLPAGISANTKPGPSGGRGGRRSRKGNA